MIENLDKIKQAIDIEIKYRYIDIHGKRQKFSSFIKGEVVKNYKKFKKDTKWLALMEAFEVYPYSSVPDRRKSIERLVKVIKSEIQKEKDIQSEEKEQQKYRKQKPSEVDVTYVKGVGPKVALKLQKLGIFTAQDLMMYFPKRHIDYSTRTLIKDLNEGQTTTLFGYIKSCSTFNTKKNLAVTKLVIKDESGKLELTFFNAKGNKYVLERMKSQFPLNSAIMVSGTVKRDDYTFGLTFDKPSYSVMIHKLR